MSTLPSSFLFRMKLQARRFDAAAARPEPLDAAYRLPFVERYPLPSPKTPSPKGKGASKEEPAFDFRLGWSEKGLRLTAILTGKRGRVRCTPSELETSDALSFFIDTRDVRDSHRASGFCHRFMFLPTDRTKGEGGQPLVLWLPIRRFRAMPRSVDTTLIKNSAQIRPGGWTLSAFLPAEVLTGYDPSQESRLGVWYSLFDHELGHFTLQHSPAFPADEDPSLWPVLELIDELPKNPSGEK